MPWFPRFRRIVAALIMFQQPSLKVIGISYIKLTDLVFEHVHIMEHNCLEVSLPGHIKLIYHIIFQ